MNPSDIKREIKRMFRINQSGNHISDETSTDISHIKVLLPENKILQFKRKDLHVNHAWRVVYPRLQIKDGLCLRVTCAMVSKKRLPEKKDESKYLSILK